MSLFQALDEQTVLLAGLLQCLHELALIAQQPHQPAHGAGDGQAQQQFKQPLAAALLVKTGQHVVVQTADQHRKPLFRQGMKQALCSGGVHPPLVLPGLRPARVIGCVAAFHHAAAVGAHPFFSLAVDQSDKPAVAQLKVLVETGEVAQFQLQQHDAGQVDAAGVGQGHQ